MRKKYFNVHETCLNGMLLIQTFYFFNRSASRIRIHVCTKLMNDFSSPQIIYVCTFICTTIFYVRMEYTLDAENRLVTPVCVWVVSCPIVEKNDDVLFSKLRAYTHPRTYIFDVGWTFGCGGYTFLF